MIIKALQQAFVALFNFRTWFVVLLPPLIAGFLLFILFLVYWNSLTLGMAHFMGQWEWIQFVGQLLGAPQSFTSIFALIVVVLLFLPVLFVTVLLVTSLFVTPLVQREVALHYFKDLEQKKGGSTAGSIGNSLKTLGIFIVLFFVSLPLWLIPGLQLLIPAVLMTWMNKKVFLYDVLQDFASPEERLIIERKESLGLWGMGGLLVLFSYIPLAFVFLPVFSAFAYSFYGLNSLSRLRKQS